MAFESGRKIAFPGERLVRMLRLCVPARPASDARRAQPRMLWGQFGAVIWLA